MTLDKKNILPQYINLIFEKKNWVNFLIFQAEEYLKLYVNIKVFHNYLSFKINLKLLRMNSNRKCSEFYTTLASHGYHPAILKSTRMTATSQTLIDNIFCNNISRSTQSGIVTNSISDQCPVFLNQKLDNPARNREIIYRIRLKNRECHI